jgi:hypothetical protein
MNKLIGFFIFVCICVIYFISRYNSYPKHTFVKQDQYYNEKNTRIMDLLMQADILYGNENYEQAQDKYRQAKRLSNHTGPSIYVEKYELN